MIRRCVLPVAAMLLAGLLCTSRPEAKGGGPLFLYAQGVPPPKAGTTAQPATPLLAIFGYQIRPVGPPLELTLNPSTDPAMPSTPQLSTGDEPVRGGQPAGNEPPPVLEGAPGLATSPNARLLFSGGKSGVTTFEVEPDGSLQSRQQKVSGVPAIGLTSTDAHGQTFVYSTGDDRIRGYAVAPQYWQTPAAVLSELPGSPFHAGIGTFGIGAAGDLLFVAARGSHSVVDGKIHEDGTFTATSSFPAVSDLDTRQQRFVPSKIRQVAVDRQGRFVYTADNNQFIFGASVDPETAVLSPLPVSHISGVQTNGDLVLGRTGVLLVFGIQGNIGVAQAFRVMKSGRLRAMSGFQPIGPVHFDGIGAAVDPSGRLLAVVGTGTNPVRLFKVNPANGHLTFRGSAPGPVDCTGLTFAQR